MRALGAAEMLRAWESGLAQPPLQRSLTLLAEAAQEPVEAMALLSLGQRDGRLLNLRERTFGEDVAAVASCPLCAAHLEMDFRTADLKVGTYSKSSESSTLPFKDHQLRWRAPNSLDLIAIAGEHDPAAARRRLLERCISDITHHDSPGAFEDLSAEILTAVVEQIAESDPQADVQIAVDCPECGHQWQASFDIATFFWNEIHAWAQHTLRDVHNLALAYGWSERDILAMSPWRRQFYLGCIATSE
jgi:hypothetical protein